MKLQLLVLWISIWTLTTAAFTSTSHVICDSIVAGKGDAKVEINIKKGSKDTPIFAFRYLELLHFDGLPVQLQFYDKDGDGTFHGVIDPRLNTFIPKADDDTNYVKGILHSDDTKGLDLKVTELGIYCVYTTKTENIDVKFRNYYGYTPFMAKLAHSITLFSLVVGCAIFAYILHYTIDIKVGLDFSNLNELLLISRAMIFYILAPYLITMAIVYLLYFLPSPLGASGGNHTFYSRILDFIQSSFSVLNMIFMLLFSMGYGVIYCRGESTQYRQLLEKRWQLAKQLLIPGFGFTLLGTLFDFLLFKIAANTVNMIAFGCTIYYYFKTKKEIRDFPPYASPSGPGELDKNKAIQKQFKLSFFIIIVWPAIFMFIVVALFISNTPRFDIRKYANGKDVSKISPAVLGELAAVYSLESMETTNNYRNILLAGILNSYGTIAAVWWIWVRKNYGIIIGSVNDGSAIEVNYEDNESLELPSELETPSAVVEEETAPKPKNVDNQT